jgi:hypothetical protein
MFEDMAQRLNGTKAQRHSGARHNGTRAHRHKGITVIISVSLYVLRVSVVLAICKGNSNFCLFTTPKRDLRFASTFVLFNNNFPYFLKFIKVKFYKIKTCSLIAKVYLFLEMF